MCIRDRLKDIKDYDISALGAGVYYYTNDPAATYTKGSTTITGNFQPIEFFGNYPNSKLADTPVFAFACMDTATAKIEATVSSDRELDKEFTVGGYKVVATDGSVTFKDEDGVMIAEFFRNDDGKVTKVKNTNDAQKVVALYQWLNDGNANAIFDAIKNGEMYMTNKNLRVAFGFTYSVKDTATWNANSTPIILDPTVSIPKTGDNASVLGFAMIMVAIVAAAVAVKKVNA